MKCSREAWRIRLRARRSWHPKLRGEYAGTNDSFYTSGRRTVQRLERSQGVKYDCCGMVRLLPSSKYSVPEVTSGMASSYSCSWQTD